MWGCESPLSALCLWILHSSQEQKKYSFELHVKFKIRSVRHHSPQLAWRRLSYTQDFVREPQDSLEGSWEEPRAPSLYWSSSCNGISWESKTLGRKTLIKLTYRKILVTNVLLSGHPACFPISDLCNCTESSFSPLNYTGIYPPVVSVHPR